MSRLEGFIDHFERDMAVIAKSDRTTANVARQALPIDAREGDFIVELNDKHQFAIDRKTTELRRREIRRMTDSLFD
jgi:hypothetical protein